MSEYIIKDFLESFLALSEGKIEHFILENNKVFGIITWKDDEEKQDFSWTLQFDEAILYKMKLLCDFIKEDKLINCDKITISEAELKIQSSKLNWNLYEAEEQINNLCSVEVKMIDDGQESDSFFIHF
jgi:hypothetical protein